VQSLFDALFAFAKLHFDTEGRLMAQVNYPAREAHEQAHTALLDELGQLKANVSSGGELLVLQTVKDWLLNHIEHADRPLGAFVVGFEQNNS
ncbi:MAG: hemerythrin family protein, partial [Burkholderiales bacterium]|nr:hemerythrin family protein [Burkholderiales bacterium]